MLIAMLKGRWTGLVLVGLLSVAALVPQAADGTFPGRNGKIAFSVKEDVRGPATIGLFTTTADGYGGGIYTGGDAFSYPAELTASWRADGRELAAERKLYKPGQSTAPGVALVTVSPLGKNLQRLTPASLDSQQPTNPAWSPDGRRVGFQMGGDIYTIAPNGTALTKLATGSEPSWSVRNQVGFVRDGDIWIMRPDGSGQHRVIRNGGSIDFSPDGRRIVFERNAGGHAQVFVAGADGRHLRQLTHGPGPNRTPSFSPDGEYIVYVGPAEAPDDAQDEIWLMRSNGKRAHVVPHSPVAGSYGSYYVLNPVWQPVRKSR